MILSANLSGKQSWIARIIRVVRPLLRNIINLSCKLKKAFHGAKLSKYMTDNFSCIIQFLHDFNGTTNVLLKQKPIFNMVSDDCMQGFLGED